jgi:hypothetical protein
MNIFLSCTNNVILAFVFLRARTLSAQCMSQGTRLGKVCVRYIKRDAGEHMQRAEVICKKVKLVAAFG